MEEREMAQKQRRVLIMTAGLALLGTIGASAGAPQATRSEAERVKRGEYLVRIMSCNDCHTPLKPGPRGPEPDMTRMLSGHPQELQMPTAPPAAGPWLMHGAGTSTAWAGPWGVSFTANLTPDKETGLGEWTEEMFLATIRTGRHQGKGRPIMPPMPVESLRAATEQDLKDLFLYLRTITPIRNKVPTPIEAPE
jgi:mono/diheme cytochrome c family protein